jgi:hypothetical protein
MKDFEIVSVAPVITGITFHLTFHMRSMFVIGFSYYKISEASFLITFIPPEIVISVKRHSFFFHGLRCPFYWYGRFSQCSLAYSIMFMLPPRPVSPDFRTSSHKSTVAKFTSISLHMVQFNWPSALSPVFMFVPQYQARWYNVVIRIVVTF